MTPTPLGWNHVDLLTEDMEATRRFYEGALGFRVARADLIELDDGGVMQHMFFDAGGGQMIAFTSGEEAPGFPKGVDTGINRGLGLSGAPYHFAFQAASEADLEARKKALAEAGVEVTGPLDHEGWCRSIYFRDPNGLQLEYCVLIRELNDDDAVPRLRFRVRNGQKVELEEEESTSR